MDKLPTDPAELLELANQFAEFDPNIANLLQQLETNENFFQFYPRPDDPAAYDEQASFCYNRDPVSFLIGGNAAGTTEAAAFKTAQFLLIDQPPPRKNTPFWIISNTYEQVCDVCWTEKLIGHGHIPECEVQWDKIAWISEKEGRPRSVPLRPWPRDRGGDPRKNWRIEFKSYEQGRAAMQARSIGGFWFSEQFPLEIFLEVLRGCREYMFDGGQFAEFTPIDPELSLWVEKAQDEQPEGWRFYRCNTQKNIPNLKEGWFEQFFALVPEEMRETRMTGALASFEGMIYPGFNVAVHVIDPENLFPLPSGMTHAFATDWGASLEHPFTTVFGCVDGMNNWIIYDEYWNNDQTKTTDEHAESVLDKLTIWGWPMVNKADKDGILRRRVSDQRDALWRGNFGDPARPGEIMKFQKMGIPTFPARNAVYDGIDTVRSLLKVNPYTGRPKLLISSTCEHLITEMRKYRWKRGRSPAQGGSVLNPQVARPEPMKRDDDTVDAMRYLIYSNAYDFSETISSMSQSYHATHRASIQLERGNSRLSRAISGMLPSPGAR